jgi:hypothetical protein
MKISKCASSYGFKESPRAPRRSLRYKIDLKVRLSSPWLLVMAHIPNNDVKMLPDTADSIFCGSDTSPMPAPSDSSALCVAVAIVSVLFAADGRVTSIRCSVCDAIHQERAAWASSSRLRVVTRAKATDA